MARVARPEDVAQMRKRLLRGAYAAIAVHGFAAVTLQDVADQAGVSKALVLYYFKDKERLLVAVMERIDGIIRARAAQAMSDSAAEGPRAQLDAYLGALTLGAQKHREFYLVYLDFLSAGLRKAEVRKSTLSFIVGCEALEEEVVTRGVAEGAFRHDLDPGEAAAVVRALIDGLSIEWLFRDDEPFARFCTRLREAVFGYLGA
jgi:TetR/AcrR family transcriptional regulator, fatty acid metabolism regulator protein